MSKRFTDTDKWKKENFTGLPLKMKMAWIYLCDNCDHAGIWDVNTPLLSFQLEEKITKEDLINSFGDKLLWISPTKVYLQSFIDFQYGILNQNNRAHKSVIIKLEKLGIIKPLMNSSEGAIEGAIEGAKDKDKEKEKDMDMDKVKDKDKESGALGIICHDSESFCEKVNPSRIIQLFNEKLSGKGKIKPCPNYFLPPKLLADFEIITGFENFQKIEQWGDYFDEVAKSDWLTKNFTPSLGWLINADNAHKVLSGQYQNKESSDAESIRKKETEALLEKYKYTEVD